MRGVVGSLLVCWFCSAVLVENPETTRREFKIGLFMFDKRTPDRFILDVLQQCEDLDIHPSFDTASAFLWFKSMQGWGLLDVAGSPRFRRANTTVSSRVSHRINACSSRVTLIEAKETLFHVALSVWPWNTLVMMNLLYYYEWHGFCGAMNALYDDALLLTGDKSLQFQHVFIAPPIMYSMNQSRDVHFHLLRRAYAYLTSSDVTPSSDRNPTHEIRELQQNIEYIGFSPGIVMDLYSQCLNHRYSSFFHKLVVPESPNREGQDFSLTIPAETAGAVIDLWQSPKRFRVGVLSEHANNGAPDLCIADVFKKMQLECSTRDDNCFPLELVFFDRMGLMNEFSEILRQKATEIIILQENNLLLSAQSILDAKLDVLMYIALPTEKYTVLLSQFRLAKTQIVFGAGHPMSSGSQSVDYNIISRHFVHDPSILTTRAVALPHNITDSEVHTLGYQCAKAASLTDNYQEYEEDFPICSSIGSIGNSIYSEQSILLDTLGYFLPDSSLYYRDFSEDSLIRFVPFSTYGGGTVENSQSQFLCSEVDDMLQRWGLSKNISTATFSIPCIDSKESSLLAKPASDRVKEKKKRLYMCIQLNRKMHPLFDRVLKGILHSDPQAVIAVSHKAEVLVDRWISSLGFNSMEKLYERFVFVPKLVHPDYLKFLSFNTVFLNTFPFGAGITTSEALAMGVPVLVLPELVSTAQLALSQIRALGRGRLNANNDLDTESDLEALLTVHSIEEYVVHAIHIADLVDIHMTGHQMTPLSRRHAVDLHQSEETLRFNGKLLKLLGPGIAGNAHQALRRHICSLKGNLFSEGVLSEVTAEWRGLLQRLASSG